MPSAKLLLCISLVTLWAFALSGQSQQHSTSTAQIVNEIDGARVPGAIPDVVAYRHFLEVLAKRPNSETSAEEARRRSYLKFFFRPSCGAQQKDDRTLSESQIERLLSVADDLAAKLAVLGRQQTSLSQTAALQARDQVTLAAIQSIPTIVDSNAAEKIKRHVDEHVKAHIKISTVQIVYPR